MRKKNYYSESLKLFWKNKLAVLSLLILVILTVSAILAPALTPYDPNKQVLADKLLFPSAEHLFGTDEFGRDILTRCLYGCRVSLSVGLVSQLIASVIGYFMGVCAGYFGKKVDDVISDPGVFQLPGAAVCHGPHVCTGIWPYESVSDSGIFILGQYGPADPRHSPAAQGAGVYSGLPN